MKEPAFDIKAQDQEILKCCKGSLVGQPFRFVEGPCDVYSTVWWLSVVPKLKNLSFTRPRFNGHSSLVLVSLQLVVHYLCSVKIYLGRIILNNLLVLVCGRVVDF